MHLAVNQQQQCWAWESGLCSTLPWLVGPPGAPTPAGYEGLVRSPRQAVPSSCTYRSCSHCPLQAHIHCQLRIPSYQGCPSQRDQFLPSGGLVRAERQAILQSPRKIPSSLPTSSCRGPVPASQPCSRSQLHCSALNCLFSLINVFYPKSRPCNRLLRVTDPAVLVSQLYFSAPSLPSSLPAIRQTESANYTTAL